MTFLITLAGGAAPQFGPLDLSRFYTAKFLGPVFPFPTGTQTWGGVPFVLGGKIEVTGMDAAREGEFLPAHVQGIPVNRKASRLHLIHATRHGQKDGVPCANLILHFKNGESRVLRLAYGVHARNTHPHEEESLRALADPNSKMIWSSNSRHNETAGGVRLFATEIDNPLPEDEITSIDWVSLFSRATPMLFAITLQTDDAPKPLVDSPKSKVFERALEHPDSAYRREMRVRVVSSEGAQQVTNSSAVLTIEDDQRSFFFGHYTAEAGEELVLPYPPQDAVSLSLRVTSPGFVPASKSFLAKEHQAWPETIELKMDPGRRIGGVVIDASNRPIADASVTPYETVQVAHDQFQRTDFEVARTASDGKWSARVPGQSLSNLSFQIHHPEQRTAVFSRLDGNELLAGKVRLVLSPETRVAGRVTNTRRMPVAGATVILDLGEDARMVRTTDNTGQFAFVVRDSTNRSAAVITLASNLAPAHRTASLERNAPDLGDIVLDDGQPFTMRLVDGANRPVSDALVTLSQWQGSQAMQWTNRTGSDGRFRWDHAPAGSVTFQYEKPGYSRHTHSMTLPVREEVTFTYSASSRIAGRVLDQETEKVIDRFQVRVRYKYRNGGGSGSSTTSGSRGRFSTYLGSMAYDELSLVIEARGYEPFGTNLPPAEGSYSNVFHLKKARMIPGIVWAADGVPAPKAEVILIDRSSSAYMDEPGKLRRNSSMSETVVANGTGNFELTPKIDADLVVAAHPTLGFAELSFKEMTNGTRLILKPWGRVEGVIRVGDKVEPYYYAAVHSMSTREPNSTRTSPSVYTYLKTKPDSDGRFVFDGVPPGTRVVYLRHLFNEKESGAMKLGHGVGITVKAGETNHVVIGGSGRTVIGKVQVTGADNIQIDWHRQQQSLRRQTVSQVPPPLSFPPNATPEERRKIIAQRTEAMNARIRADNLIQQNYSIVVEEDGRFHAHSVPPGTYMLQLSAVQSQSTTSYRHLGSSSRQVVVPEGAGAHDLGIIAFQIRQ